MQLFHTYHQNKLHKLMHSEFWLFESSVWLHVFARSLIAVFIPVLFLLNGLSLGDVVLFYFMYCLIDVPFNFVARALLQKIGARWVIMLGTIALIVFFVLFYQLNFTPWMLFWLAFASAVYDTFYWVGHIYVFIESNNTNKRSSGKSTSIFYIVRMLAGIAAPIIGALILIFVSEHVLITISIAVLLLSMVPLYKMKHMHNKPIKPGIPFKKFFKEKIEKRSYLSMSLFSLHNSAEGVFWPLFIFTVFGTIESVAYLPVIVSITTVLFTYFAGNIKKGDRSKMIAIGAVLIAMTWLSRFTTDNQIYYYVSVFLIGLFSILIAVPLDSDLFSRGKKLDSLNAATYRNTASMGVKCLLYGALLILLNVFNVSFIIAIVALFGLLLLNAAAVYGGRASEG